MKKRRVGLILPSVNIHMEPEFNRLRDVLPDIDYFATRVFLTDTTEEALVDMERGLESAAGLIETVTPEAVIYACTSGSFIKGAEWDAQIMEKITRICHCPSVTASRAMVNALRAMKIERMTLVTPYTDDINRQEKKFIEQMGVRVVAMEGLQIVDAETLRTQTEEQMMDLAIRADVPESQAVFISCTNVEGMYIAERLEDKLGKPVLSSNSVCLWNLLKLLDYNAPIAGCGRLLARGARATAE